VVDGAIKARKITPASRDQYLALCATREGVDKLKGIFKDAPEVVSAGAQAPEGSPAPAGTVALNAEETATYKALGYTEEEIKKLKEGKK
jgi:phage I-like protein